MSLNILFSCNLTENFLHYRSEEDEIKDIKEYSQKKNNVGLKKKILPSLFKEDAEEVLQEEKDKKASKSKRRRNRKKANQNPENKGIVNQPNSNQKKKKGNRPDVNPDALLGKSNYKSNSDNASIKRKRKKNGQAGQNNQQGQNGAKKAKIDINAELSISDARLEHYGLNPRQFKKKMRGQKFKKTKN